MNIVVTGGAGFIGSAFVRLLCKEHPEDTIIVFDKLTYAGNVNNLRRVQSAIEFVQGDICSEDDLEKLFGKYDVDAVVHFAAESHVDRSIVNPGAFVQTNVYGTQMLLHAAKKADVEKYVQVSTDEVYGSLGETGLFTEQSPLEPNSPYSASKAGADLLARAYFETYGMNINITRCSNNYGPYHFPEKLIPLMITNALQNKSMPIYGDGKQIRDWLHVDDHCRGIDLVLRTGQPGEVYNIGGRNERTNEEIVRRIVQTLGVSEELITHVEDRLGHDFRYAIDATKIERELGWKAMYTFNEGLAETIDWYIQNKAWWQDVLSGVYRRQKL
ncbi:dTDP-glucose 4,6-dehydratase [Alkalihalobacillus sp. LMS6]|uniref:dTDP-glucose 4,6-dehydratase n=1 Tax=Alkalihalobacillus sp. LMS6 TaxID=2924034 RepID=UPI0020D166E4|nr:dTDP-glucose 4,6-dehydratase [Alkalihalobacillus sp. LMS6]UTR07410.1 dTDP-glucose 4,6-dehydratase [Alkalihalobacillus sp. LMS6]